MSGPKENAVVVPARQAYSHSASLGRRAASPGSRLLSSLMKLCASCQLTFSTGFCRHASKWLGLTGQTASQNSCVQAVSASQ